MTFQIPNEADAFNGRQAEIDKVDLDILVAALQGQGVLEGSAVVIYAQFISHADIKMASRHAYISPLDQLVAVEKLEPALRKM